MPQSGFPSMPSTFYFIFYFITIFFFWGGFYIAWLRHATLVLTNTLPLPPHFPSFSTTTTTSLSLLYDDHHIPSLLSLPPPLSLPVWPTLSIHIQHGSRGPPRLCLLGSDAFASSSKQEPDVNPKRQEYDILSTHWAFPTAATTLSHRSLSLPQYSLHPPIKLVASSIARSPFTSALFPTAESKSLSADHSIRSSLHFLRTFHPDIQIPSDILAQQVVANAEALQGQPQGLNPAQDGRFGLGDGETLGVYRCTPFSSSSSSSAALLIFSVGGHEANQLFVSRMETSESGHDSTSSSSSSSSSSPPPTLGQLEYIPSEVPCTTLSTPILQLAIASSSPSPSDSSQRLPRLAIRTFTETVIGDLLPNSSSSSSHDDDNLSPYLFNVVDRIVHSSTESYSHQDFRFSPSSHNHGLLVDRIGQVYRWSLNQQRQPNLVKLQPQPANLGNKTEPHNSNDGDDHNHDPVTIADTQDNANFAPTDDEKRDGFWRIAYSHRDHVFFLASCHRLFQVDFSNHDDDSCQVTAMFSIRKTTSMMAKAKFTCICSTPLDSDLPLLAACTTDQLLWFDMRDIQHPLANIQHQRGEDRSLMIDHLNSWFDQDLQQQLQQLQRQQHQQHQQQPLLSTTFLLSSRRNRLLLAYSLGYQLYEPDKPHLHDILLGSQDPRSKGHIVIDQLPIQIPSALPCDHVPGARPVLLDLSNVPRFQPWCSQTKASHLLLEATHRAALFARPLSCSSPPPPQGQCSPPFLTHPSIAVHHPTIESDGLDSGPFDAVETMVFEWDHIYEAAMTDTLNRSVSFSDRTSTETLADMQALVDQSKVAFSENASFTLSRLFAEAESRRNNSRSSLPPRRFFPNPISAAALRRDPSLRDSLNRIRSTVSSRIPTQDMWRCQREWLGLGSTPDQDRHPEQKPRHQNGREDEEDELEEEEGVKSEHDQDKRKKRKIKSEPDSYPDFGLDNPGLGGSHSDFDLDSVAATIRSRYHAPKTPLPGWTREQSQALNHSLDHASQQVALDLYLNTQVHSFHRARIEDVANSSPPSLTSNPRGRGGVQRTVTNWAYVDFPASSSHCPPPLPPSVGFQFFQPYTRAPSRPEQTDSETVAEPNRSETDREDNNEEYETDLPPATTMLSRLLLSEWDASVEPAFYTYTDPYEGLCRLPRVSNLCHFRVDRFLSASAQALGGFAASREASTTPSRSGSATPRPLVSAQQQQQQQQHRSRSRSKSRVGVGSSPAATPQRVQPASRLPFHYPPHFSHSSPPPPPPSSSMEYPNHSQSDLPRIAERRKVGSLSQPPSTTAFAAAAAASQPFPSASAWSSQPSFESLTQPNSSLGLRKKSKKRTSGF